MMYKKQNELARDSENLAKIYIIEIKTVRSFLWPGWRKNAGGKNEDKVRDIIENKWIKMSFF